jgi:DNA-binding CsgD family transcriptional regulator
MLHNPVTAAEAIVSDGPQNAARVLPAILSNVGHGSHLCAFYETKDDLIDLVLPFFDAGSNRGELCVWMAPDNLATEEATAVVAQHHIELYPGRTIYQRASRFEREPVVRFWDERLHNALATSRPGMRVSGDAFWLQAADWRAFLDYEADLNAMIADKPITLLCTYPISASRAGDLFEVACAHHVAIAKRNRAWEIIKGWGTSDAPATYRPDRTAALQAADRMLSLSRRERQVLDAVMEGRSNKMIARDLGITVRTVEAHRVRLLERLGVRTTVEAVRLATLSGLITQQ